MMNPTAGLDAAFAAKLAAFLDDLGQRGYVFHPYFGVRDPVTQGALWRQSRPTSAVALKIAQLHTAGAPFLAACIEHAPARTGSWVTNAGPGLSWHQWGLACDCIWQRAGKGTFDTQIDGGRNGYRVYADVAARHGLTCLRAIGDNDHVQLPGAPSPLGAHKLPEIDAAMKARWGSALPV